MQESFYRYMKVGIVHFMAYPQVLKGEGPILETLEKILSDNFFTAIEVTWMKDDAVLKKAKEMLASAHVAVGFGSQPPLLTQKLDLNSSIPAERKKAVDECKRSIDTAIFLNAQGVAFLSGKDPGEPQRKEAHKLLIDSLRQLCSYARSKSGGRLKVILETFDRQPFGKNCLIGPSEEAVEIAKALRIEYPGFGLMLDLSHLPLLNETSKKAITTAGDYLVQAHIGNCIMKDTQHPARGDFHPRFGVPEGENDVAELTEFLKTLLETKFLDTSKPPIVSFEVAPMFGESSEIVIANAKRVLQEAWTMV